ncbi:MAG: NifX-associated nitrogen fixation protein [Azospirillum sp.]|nr:NifX-associated nitrogen fixation protein [Azospirillum sp.]
MGEAAETLPAEPTAILEHPFLKILLAVYRADDSHGSWDGRKDEDLLADFVVTKEQRKLLPIIANPDPDVLWRVELFYKAVGLAAEKRIGIMVTPMMVMSGEGFGRVVLLAGRLVAYSRHLRDVHRFGYPSLERLATEGAIVVERVIETINDHPEVARA